MGKVFAGKVFTSLYITSSHHENITENELQN